MWYGSYKLPNIRRLKKNKNYRDNLKDRQIGKFLPRRNSNVVTQSMFRLPYSWKILILSRTGLTQTDYRIYAYDDVYFYNIAPIARMESIQLDRQTNLITFTHRSSSYFYFAFLKLIADISAKFSRPFFKKIRFKGKGYYMYKNTRNTIAPQFGYAHRVYVYAPAMAVKFLSKTKILLYGLSKNDIFAAAYSLKQVKPINIFTGRGVRFARQIVYKKTGKVSSYR